MAENLSYYVIILLGEPLNIKLPKIEENSPKGGGDCKNIGGNSRILIGNLLYRMGGCGPFFPLS